MSARDDFPITAHYATLSPCTNGCKHDHCARWRESRSMIAEIDQARSERADLPASFADMAALWARVQREVAYYDEHYPNGAGLTEAGHDCRAVYMALRSVRAEVTP